jgi:hypothetical protein
MKIRTLRAAAAARRKPTPLGALARGLVAGAIGAGAQSLFFMATKRWMPKPTRVPRKDSKPEPEAIGESSLETVARRTIESMMQRGPIDDGTKSVAASAVHYGFGAAWGGLFALTRESMRTSGPLFGALVWMASDNFLLPLFRLAAWPNRYSFKEHHYALQAHFVYGASTAAAYAALRDVGPVKISAVPALLGLQIWAWFRRSPPARLFGRSQSWPRRVVNRGKLALA